jgi:hypothetical protein
MFNPEWLGIDPTSTRSRPPNFLFHDADLTRCAKP